MSTRTYLIRDAQEGAKLCRPCNSWVIVLVNVSRRQLQASTTNRNRSHNHTHSFKRVLATALSRWKNLNSYTIRVGFVRKRFRCKETTPPKKFCCSNSIPAQIFRPSRNTRGWRSPWVEANMESGGETIAMDELRDDHSLFLTKSSLSIMHLSIDSLSLIETESIYLGYRVRYPLK